MQILWLMAVDSAGISTRLMRPSTAPAAAREGGAAVGMLRNRLGWRRFSFIDRKIATWRCSAAEGPSCIFVGPIDNASKETLEALYHQARDSYYSGKPLIVDDMFDKIELKLRLYGSKSVVKYPRCSLRKQAAYADAEEDPSQVLALASIWILLFTFGTFVFLLPTLLAVSTTSTDAFSSRVIIDNVVSPLHWLSATNTFLLVGLGFLVGIPISSASVQALKGLLANDLVALKGYCPHCGEEVFAFVKSGKSHQQPHRTECHVCGSFLEFRTKLEKYPGKNWVYGRIYLLPSSNSGRRRWG
ncbi:PGR5-like A protein [Wolffia australiana]